MDYGGIDLYKKLVEKKQHKQKFNNDQIIDWLIQALKGLAFAKSKNILHRDIKPYNFVVNELS